jgi:hypothetical protein
MDLRLGLVKDRTMSEGVSSLSSFLLCGRVLFEGTKSTYPRAPTVTWDAASEAIVNNFDGSKKIEKGIGRARK